MNIDDVAKNGVVGAGGAGFPTHVKLKSRPEVVIMNAAECEPLLHKDMEMLKNYSGEVMQGFRIVMELTGADKGIIGIKEKHKDIIDLLKAKQPDNVQIIRVGDFYPAGDEITLIYLTTGRIVQPGELPIRVGCLVQNVETLYHIAMDKPVVEKTISVAGAVNNPATIRVPVGTSFQDILSHFEVNARNFRVRSGGLMMGELEEDLDKVVTKRMGGLIVLPSDHHCVVMYERFATDHAVDRIAKAGCDQCNFCTEFCPRYLIGFPVRPETAMRNRMFTREDQTMIHPGNEFCCECNLCTLYACPESLDPKGATVIEKRKTMNSDEKWEGLPVSVHPMMDYRKVPTKKLMQRLDVLKYQDEARLTDIEISPDQVRIPLCQHVGTPARPVVGIGDYVKKYDLIAEASANISANVHASIDGEVTDLSDGNIIIQRKK